MRTDAPIAVVAHGHEASELVTCGVSDVKRGRSGFMFRLFTAEASPSPYNRTSLWSSLVDLNAPASLPDGTPLVSKHHFA